MKYISICSGIEAATVAWHPLGWHPLAFSEIEPFPSAVLRHHWPEIPNLGDMTQHHEWPTDLRPDLIVGGTPCQAFSVSGLRQGLADPRGNLTLTFLSILAQYRPQWVVWENVPGILSDKTGAFGAFLGGLGELGYGFAYRILDAQHFGVPQRRRRVFVVAHLGDWRHAAAVLFERESLQGNHPPSRQAREEIAGTLGARTCRSIGAQDADLGHLIAPSVTSKWAKGSGGPSGDECQNLVTHALRGEGFDASEDGTGRGTPMIQAQTAVRRLTPRECERLQGFPDDHTRIPGLNGWRDVDEGECLESLREDGMTVKQMKSGKWRVNDPDGPRYKAIGNSMAVPVMRWIGQRIVMIEALAKKEAVA